MMPFFARRCANCVALLLLLLTAPSLHAQEELETVGLAVYTETARDIYIAGLKLPYGAVMQNLMLAPPPKAMEYRIATRRISARGFSGTILLQAELGSGGRAPEAAINALGALKRRMKGSLKQGDTFQIYLDEDDNTNFIVNGTELVSIDDGGVFDFFYSGWVGDGAAATLREPLLAGTLDPGVMDRYKQLEPTSERIAAVAAWTNAQTASQPKPVAAPAPAAPTPVAEPADTKVAATSAAPEDTAAEAELEVAATEAAAPAETAHVARASAANKAAAPSTPAVIQPQVVAIAEEPESPLLQLDDREYQLQLQQYVSDVMRAVYGEVKYPRRAIKYNWEGKVEVLARIDAKGKLLDVEITSSSGHAALDKSAQTAVERAAPLPALTPVAQEELIADEGEGYMMSIPITFALQ